MPRPPARKYYRIFPKGYDPVAVRIPVGPWSSIKAADDMRRELNRRDPLKRVYAQTFIACYRTRDQARAGHPGDPFNESTGRMQV